MTKGMIWTNGMEWNGGMDGRSTGIFAGPWPHLVQEALGVCTSAAPARMTRASTSGDGWRTLWILDEHRQVPGTAAGQPPRLRGGRGAPQRQPPCPPTDTGPAPAADNRLRPRWSRRSTATPPGREWRSRCLVRAWVRRQRKLRVEAQRCSRPTSDSLGGARRRRRRAEVNLVLEVVAPSGRSRTWPPRGRSRPHLHHLRATLLAGGLATLLRRGLAHRDRLVVDRHHHPAAALAVAAANGATAPPIALDWVKR